MKYLLIAIYLGHGSGMSRTQTEQFPDKEACQAMASRYVKQVTSGQSRAFCLRLTDPQGKPL